MEIELVTTKKKLTKSIIEQMLFANVEDLDMIDLYPDRVLGYVVIKGEKCAIVKGIDDWKKLYIQNDWKASTLGGNTECIFNNRYIRFPTPADRDKFLERYKVIREMATTHIYI